MKLRLRAYFESSPSEKVSLVLTNSFADSLYKFFLILVRDLCEVFETAVLKVESNTICGNEAINIVKDVLNKIHKQIDASFISISEVNGIDLGAEADTFANIVCPLYRKFI